MCPRDTSPEAWKVFVELQRRMSPSEKLRRTLDYSDSIRHAAEQGLRQRYPEAGQRELFLMMARMTLGTELCRKVYGDAFDERAGGRP
jgi:hypothetical protein